MDYTGDVQTATVLMILGRCFVKEEAWPVAYSTEGVAGSDFELVNIGNKEACTEM